MGNPNAQQKSKENCFHSGQICDSEVQSCRTLETLSLLSNSYQTGKIEGKSSPLNWLRPITV